MFIKIDFPVSLVYAPENEALGLGKHAAVHEWDRAWVLFLIASDMAEVLALLQEPKTILLLADFILGISLGPIVVRLAHTIITYERPS